MYFKRKTPFTPALARQGLICMFSSFPVLENDQTSVPNCPILQKDSNGVRIDWNAGDSWGTGTGWWLHQCIHVCKSSEPSTQDQYCLLLCISVKYVAHLTDTGGKEELRAPTVECGICFSTRVPNISSLPLLFASWVTEQARAPLWAPQCSTYNHQHIQLASRGEYP